MAFAHRIQPRHVLPLVLTRDLDFWPHVLLEAAPLRGTFFPKIGRLSVLMAVLLPDFCESCEDLSYSTILVTTVVRAYRPIAIMHSSKIGKLIRQLALRRGVLNYILVDPLDTTFLRPISSSIASASDSFDKVKSFAIPLTLNQNIARRWPTT